MVGRILGRIDRLCCWPSAWLKNYGENWVLRAYLKHMSLSRLKKPRLAVAFVHGSVSQPQVTAESREIVVVKKAAAVAEVSTVSAIVRAAVV